MISKSETERKLLGNEKERDEEESRARRKKEKWLPGWSAWFTWNPNKYQEFLADLIRQRADRRGKYPYKWRENTCRVRTGLNFHRGEIDGSLGEPNENEPFLPPSLSLFRLSPSRCASVPFTFVSRRSYPFFPMRLPDCIYQRLWKTRPPISRRPIVALNHDSFAKRSVGLTRH